MGLRLVYGKSGTGKSTLVKTILGLIKPLEGKMNLKEGKIGYLPQQTMIQKDFPAHRTGQVRYERFCGICRQRACGQA